MKKVALICSLVSTVALAGNRSELEAKQPSGTTSVETCETKVSVGSKEVTEGKCKPLKGFIHHKSSSGASLVDRKSKQ